MVGLIETLLLVLLVETGGSAVRTGEPVGGS